MYFIIDAKLILEGQLFTLKKVKSPPFVFLQPSCIKNYTKALIRSKFGCEFWKRVFCVITVLYVKLHRITQNGVPYDKDWIHYDLSIFLILLLLLIVIVLILVNYMPRRGTTYKWYS